MEQQGQPFLQEHPSKLELQVNQMQRQVNQHAHLYQFSQQPMMQIVQTQLTPTCSASGKIITVNIAGSLQAGGFQININSVITNPMTTNPSTSFTFSTLQSSVIKEQLTSGITLTAAVGSMSSFSLVPGSQIVGASTQLVVNFVPSHNIPANGVIQLTFPLWNPNAPSAQQLDYFQSAISCQTIAVLSSSLICSYTSQTLTVTSAVQAQIGSGTTVSFRISVFTNPLSTATISGFTITTMDQSSGKIDYGTASLAITQPATISTASFVVDSSTSSSIAGIVQEKNNMLVTFTLPVPLNPTCNIKLIIPAQFDITNTNQIAIFGIFGTMQTLSSSQFIVDTTSNTISFTSCTAYADKKQSAAITIYNVILPYYTKATSSVQIIVTGAGNVQVATLTSGLTFTASPGVLTLVSSSPATTIVQSITDVQIIIKPKHNLQVNSKIIVSFPSAFSSVGSSCSISNTAVINSGAICSQSGTTYTLTNILNSLYNADTGSNLQFTISQIKLPQTTQSAISGFIVTTYIQDVSDLTYYKVDTLSTTIPFSLSPGLVSASVTPGSYTTSIVTQYTFQFSTAHDIPQNGYVQIGYPSQISIPDISYSQSQTTNVGFPSPPSFTISTSTKTITINNGFRSSAAASGSSFTFTMQGIQNPLTQQRTSSFVFSTFRQDGNMIDQIAGGVFLVMTSSAYMSSISIILDSYVNAAVTTYTFSLTATVPVYSNNYIFISFPSEITLPSRSTNLNCQPKDKTIINTVSCYLTSRVTNGVQVSLNFPSGTTQINALQTFSFSMDSIINPNSTEPTSTFSITITDPSYNNINSNEGSIYITTTTPFTLPASQGKIYQDNNEAGQSSNYYLAIYPTHTISQGGGVQITYPSQISLPSQLSVSFKSTMGGANPTLTYDKTTRIIILSNAFSQKFVAKPASAYFNITLSGFKNPLSNSITDSFIVQTFDTDSTKSNYYYIDWMIQGLTLNSACNYPCKSCSSSDASYCLSCYSTGTLNKLQDNTCVSSCSLGRYLEPSTGVCQYCDSTCLSCILSANNCQTCGIGDYLYLLNNQCLKGCPSGYIANSKINQCQTCQSPCSTCQNTITTCTSCLSSSLQPYYYASQSACYASCPDKVTVLQDNKCVDCDSTCKTCSGSTGYCTSCESYMKFDQSRHTCIQMCSKDTQIYNQVNGNCDYCSTNCVTCSGTVSTCTSCSTSLVLNTDNTCQSSCNNASQIAINGTCTSCQLPCSQCKESTTHCTKCSGSYLLYNTTCVQYCPLKYEANNATGQCILVGLICPPGFTINEAGDGCIPNQIECKSGYMINKGNTACIPKPGFPVPFPFLILSFCFGMIVVGSHIRDKFFTKVVTCLIALIGSQEMLIYLLMLAYSISLQQYGALILTLVGTIMLFVANLSFFIYYKRDILKKDVTFYKWCRMYPRTAKYLPLAALVINFKVIKMLYSGFFGQESCLVQFENPQKSFLTPLKFVTYFSFVFVYIPIFIADIFIFSNVQWGYQLLVLAIESFLLMITIIILTIIEFRQKDGLIMSGDEQYIRIKPKTFDGQSNVMSGLIDMDERTLIRARLDDDDYEVQLRKRALFSILDQVGKNFFNCQNKGVDLGGHIDYVMTKFDEDKLKLRRAFSLEQIKEEESWVASGDESQDQQSNQFLQEDFDEEGNMRRRYSFPLTPRTLAEVQNPQFNQTLQDIKANKKKDQLNDNVYADCKPPDRLKEKKQKKMVSRRTQTYLRELLCLQGEDLLDSDLEIIMEDEAEIDQDFAKDLIDNVIDGLSDSESAIGRRKGKKKKVLAGKRAKEIPDFELADIMGEFEIDDLGNFIILKGEKSELLDKRERRVNRRGYLVDRFGNVINHKGQVIFKAVELDSDDEIPAPFGFEKRKKNLLNMGEENQFKVEDGPTKKPGVMETDEDVIDKELKEVKKGKRKKKKTKGKGDGTDVVEEQDDEEESSIDSLMADSPGKYQLNQDDTNEDEIIDKVTRKKVPKKKGIKQLQSSSKKVNSMKIGLTSSPTESQRKKQQSPVGNAPPKRIKRDDTREMFPSLAIENSEQKKLYKLAESIGNLASQFADDQRSNLKSGGSQQNHAAISQERLEKLKQEHFRDIINSSQGPRGDSSKELFAQAPISFQNIGNRIVGEHPQRQQLKSSQNLDKKLPPKNPLEKVYGNLGDVVGYEERQILEQIRGGGPSPFSSQLTSRMDRTGQNFGALVGDRRLKGLESIYLQKFDKKTGKGLKGRGKPKFRQTLNRFVDDPELLMDDGGMDFSKQNEVSLMVADKLDRLQRQYMTNTAASKIEGYHAQSQLGGVMNSAGGAFGKKPGSVSGSIFNQEPSLEPVKKGNWIEKS